MKLIAYDELSAAPWKNGGGVTRELACRPANASLNDFVWRVSIADVAGSGPFSVFPGIDRVITLLDGDGMHLQFAHGGAHALTKLLQPYCFRGEDKLDAQLVGSPSRDFNVMVRRDAARCDVNVVRECSAIPGRMKDISDVGNTTLLLFCASGSWRANDVNGAGQILKQSDALLIENPDSETVVAPLSADSALLCVRIMPK